ncbi:glycosyltransferase [Chryseobacterium indologenes]|uniref:glycosyltransferase n=1 Tax=Chryseobacterium indologenes TaxID=253 RepID=UPI001BD14206|nr:glycosyltransferase [Chryseobacterium indologenes]
MKIYHIINSLRFGGAERLVVDLCTELSEGGSDEIHLLLLDDIDTSLKKEVENNENIKIEVIPSKSLYDIRIPFFISKIVADADVIHLHLFPTLYWGVLSKLFFSEKQKVVFTEHSTENNRRSKWYFKRIEKFIYSKLNSIICISESTEKNLIHHLGSGFKAKMKVINNGVNLIKFYNSEAYSRTAYNLSDKDFLLIQVASFRAAKDQPTLIRALTLLPSHVKAMFVGDGPELENCKELVKNNGLESRAFFLGNQTNIAELIKMSDVVVVSSHYEGFGIVAVEGMACKKPVVASNVPGLSEVVAEYGILFDKGKEKCLTEVINKLNKDEAFYKEVSENCYTRSNIFSIKEIANQYRKIYKL